MRLCARCDARMRTATAMLVSRADPHGPPTPTTITADRTWTVGRAENCDIVVDDNRVSRRHLVLETAGTAWVIRDVSANGSWADGVRIGPVGIPIPDVGEVRLRLGDRAGPELVVAGASGTLAAAPTIAAGPSLAELPTIPERPARVESPTRPPERRVRHRRRRLLLVIIGVLVVLLVAADRVAAAAASGVAVQQVVQQGQGLGTKPTVSFGGFPFLTQVLFGKYTDIAIGIDDITPPGGPRINHLSAHLEGAHIPLSKALHNNVKTIPVDHIAATASIDFTDLNGFLKTQPGGLVLAAGQDGAVRISGNVDEDGSTIAVTGSAKLQATDGQLTLVPSDLHVTGTGFDDLIGSLGGLFSLFPPIPVPLPDLPFNLQIKSVSANRSGIAVSASIGHIVLDASSK